MMGFRLEKQDNLMGVIKNGFMLFNGYRELVLFKVSVRKNETRSTGL